MDGYSFMQLIRTILIGLTVFISSGAFLAPYWYQFTVEVQVSKEKSMPVDINMGLFYMDQGTNIDMVDLVFLDKATNAKTFPPMFRVAQIFYGIGDSVMFVCFIASLIYTMRRYKSSTGEICLGGALLPAALSLILGVVFALLASIIDDESSWEAFPVPNSYVQVKAKPSMTIYYGLYAAAVGAILGLVSFIIGAMQACSMCRHIENVRYQMLFAPLTEDEKGVGHGETHHFQPKRGFRYDGDSRPGIEVDF